MLFPAIHISYYYHKKYLKNSKNIQVLLNPVFLYLTPQLKSEYSLPVLKSVDWRSHIQTKHNCAKQNSDWSKKSFDFCFMRIHF